MCSRLRETQGTCDVDMATPGIRPGVPGHKLPDREGHDGHYERTAIGFASDPGGRLFVLGNEVAIDSHGCKEETR